MSCEIAGGLKTVLEACAASTGKHVEILFSEDMLPCRDWYEEIKGWLDDTEVAIFLITKKNSERPWLFFELGYFFSRYAKDEGGKSSAIPIILLLCEDEINLDDTPFDSSRLQKTFLRDEKSMRKLIEVMFDAKAALKYSNDSLGKPLLAVHSDSLGEIHIEILRYLERNPKGSIISYIKSYAKFCSKLPTKVFEERLKELIPEYVEKGEHDKYFIAGKGLKYLKSLDAA